MRRTYLLPVLIVVPLLIAIYLLAELDFQMTPVNIALLIGAYFFINILYSLVRKTFHVSVLVELTLVSLIAYLVLINIT